MTTATKATTTKKAARKGRKSARYEGGAWFYGGSMLGRHRRLAETDAEARHADLLHKFFYASQQAEAGSTIHARMLPELERMIADVARVIQAEHKAADTPTQEKVSEDHEQQG